MSRRTQRQDVLSIKSVM